jgi:hypothetical protein
VTGVQTCALPICIGSLDSGMTTTIIPVAILNVVFGLVSIIKVFGRIFGYFAEDFSGVVHGK